VLFSTYVGGSIRDSALSLAVDPAGNVFVAGSTQSVDYPVTPGAMEIPNNGQGYLYTSSHIALTKLDASGSSLIFSAVMGGSTDDEVARIAIDSAGNSFLTGYTSSIDFPVTSGAHDDRSKIAGQWFRNNKIFAVKVNATGTSLIYSAVIGGSGGDQATGLAVDSSGAPTSPEPQTHWISRLRVERIKSAIRVALTSPKGSFSSCLPTRRAWLSLRTLAARRAIRSAHWDWMDRRTFMSLGSQRRLIFLLLAIPITCPQRTVKIVYL